jgi:hypothetical protein
MTDRDIVERVGGLWARAVFPVRPRKDSYRVPYITVLKGSHAVALMKTVRPHMGISRREQIDRAVATLHRRVARRGVVTPINELTHDECSPACERAWLAGLLEGEGAFGTTWADGHRYPVLQITMCDEDVVRRAATMLGAASVRVRQPRNSRWNLTYVAKISGYPAADMMRALHDLMGARRRAAIDKALAMHRPIQLRAAPEHCIVDGCDAPHRGRGLCHKHYMSWSRDVAKGRTPRVRPLR